jgi:hypothetical protein
MEDLIDSISDFIGGVIAATGILFAGRRNPPCGLKKGKDGIDSTFRFHRKDD